MELVRKDEGKVAIFPVTVLNFNNIDIILWHLVYRLLARCHFCIDFSLLCSIEKYCIL